MSFVHNTENERPMQIFMDIRYRDLIQYSCWAAEKRPFFFCCEVTLCNTARINTETICLSWAFGCMRFQRKQGKIDMTLAEQQIMQAFEAGVNYYDTAYIYPGSEAAIGEIFEKNGIREKIYIATKLPHYLIKSVEGMEKLFQE